jgi:hypothetical protein
MVVEADCLATFNGQALARTHTATSRMRASYVSQDTVFARNARRQRMSAVVSYLQVTIDMGRLRRGAVT